MMEEILNDAHFWLAISFLIFLGILWKAAWPSVVAGLDAKIAKIQNDLQAAQALREEAHELLRSYHAKTKSAQEESLRISREADHSVRDLLAQAEIDLKDTIALKERQLADRISRMKQAAISELQSYAADLAIDAASEIVARRLDAKADSRLIDQAMQDVRIYLN
ncbi:MAG: hypothetical protein L6Q57_09055 [Alphaproteobacteria bacterium]|nr:hypothetical protein [Alphaproteobacteria bacterium]